MGDIEATIKLQQAEQRKKDLDLLIRHGFTYQTGGEVQGPTWELIFQTYERRVGRSFWEVTLYSDLNHEVEFIDENGNERGCTWQEFLEKHLETIPVIVRKE